MINSKGVTMTHICQAWCENPYHLFTNAGGMTWCIRSNAHSSDCRVCADPEVQSDEVAYTTKETILRTSTTYKGGDVSTYRIVQAHIGTGEPPLQRLINDSAVMGYRVQAIDFQAQRALMVKGG
jgi:hypothetical protein